MNPEPAPSGEFDEYADSYDASLEKGLAVSGESKDFFAEGRVQWLKRRLGVEARRPRAILDFGCGTGSAAPFLFNAFAPSRILGVDVSEKSLEVARREHAGLPADFQTLRDWTPDGSCDLAFCNGVFHHIPVRERPEAMRRVRAALKPGGLFALWENNPWNPGTRYVMHRIPFDRDAVLVWPRTARRLLTQAGFEVLRTDFLFVFPRPLRSLRCLEPALAPLPLGAQYQVLARNPGSPD